MRTLEGGEGGKGTRRGNRSESGEEGAAELSGAVDSSSNVTFGQNRRSLESNYRYARWKLSGLFMPLLCSATARSRTTALGNRAAREER